MFFCFRSGSDSGECRNRSPWPMVLLFRIWAGITMLLIPAAVAGSTPTEYLDLTTTLTGQRANAFVSMLEDPGQKLTFEDILSADGGKRFVPLDREVINRGISRSAWWVELKAINPADQPVSWLIEATYPHTDYLDAYMIAADGTVRSIRLGDRRPFSNRPIATESFVIPVETAARSTTRVLIRMVYQEVGLLDAHLRLWSPEEFSDWRELNGLVMGAYFGGMLFMLLYNLFIFCSTRMPEYFWYVVYMVATTAFGFANLGLGHRYLYTESVPLTEQLHILLMSATMGSLIQFSRVFLKTHLHTPRLDRFFKLGVLVAAAGAALLLAGYKELTGYVLRGLGLYILIFPFLGAWIWYSGERRARFYTIAWLIAGLFFTFSLGRWFGISETSFLTIWGGRIGLWIEAVLFSLALADHINLLRKEKEKARAREQVILVRTTEELEEQVQKRTRDLEHARLRADEASAAKSAFLATMSHEIRTPMNGILGNAHLALNTTLTHQQREYLSRIRSSTRYLLEIINNILDFSKIEAGKLKVERIDFSLEAVIADLSSLFAAKARSNHLGFELLMAPGTPVQLTGDSLRLKQVLANLISNAVKFTDSGWVRLEIDPVTVADGKALLRFRVQDTGIGMTVEQQRTLFQAFTQADDSTTREYGGTGLGLTISQRLVKQMGGEITVSSEPGRGSAFSFSLWFEQAEVAETARMPAQSETATKEPLPAFQPARILLVEDNPTNQQVARELLESVGLSVTIARDGLEAVEAVRLKRFELVLMDIQMPNMDGYQATAVIREDTRFRELPIIAMTAHALSADQKKCLDAGMNDHVGKPVEPMLLYRALARWLPVMPAEVPASATIRDREELPDKLPGIDLAIGLSRVGGNRRLFRKLLVEFHQDHHDAAEQLEKALRFGRVEQARRLAHTLKGVAGNLGAQELFRSVSQLETALESGVASDAGREAFEAALSRLMAGLKRLTAMATEPPVHCREGIPDLAVLQPLLTGLKKQLNEANPEASEQLEQIRRALGGHFPVPLGELDRYVQAFQFEEADIALQALVRLLDAGQKT